MPGRAKDTPVTPVAEIKIKSAADASNGKQAKAPTPKAVAEPITKGQDRVMTRAAAQQDLENRLKLQEAESAAAKASRDIYKSSFAIFMTGLPAALKGGDADIEVVTNQLRAASVEQAIKNSNKALSMKTLEACDLKGKELAAKVTQVCDLVPKILDSMGGKDVLEVQRLVVPLLKGQATWKDANYAVSEKCRRDDRGVEGLCDLVSDLCAVAGAKDEFQYVREAAVTVVAVLISS